MKITKALLEAGEKKTKFVIEADIDNEDMGWIAQEAIKQQKTVMREAAFQVLCLTCAMNIPDSESMSHSSLRE